MTDNKLQIWLKEGESEKLEFKTSFGQETIETLTAFANAKGGVVLVGVADNGEVKGISLAKESVNQWINEIKSKTAPQLVPDVEIFEIENKTVASLTIAEYPVKPVACKGRYFRRKANTNHQLSSGEVANLHLQTVNSSWDCYVREEVSMDEISFEKVQSVMDKIQKRNPAIADNPLSFLFKYRLIKETQITNACYLLFARENNLYATIELGLFTEETLIKDSARIKSDLFAEVDDVMGFIRKNIRKEIIITGNPQNTERWEYPLDAIRELVLNMIVHRDYTSSYDSVVKIFPDRIEFYNPGALPDEISLQQLLEDYYVSQPRNKLIAEMFKEAGLIEKYGSGIKRVIQAFDEMNLPKPNFISMPSGFKVVVYGRKTDLKTDLKTENGMRTDLKTDLKTENGMRTDLKTDLKTENGMGTDLKTDLKTGNGIKTDLKIDTVDMLIVEMIAQNATITIPEIAQRINKGYSATKVRLAKLKQNDYVERIGSLKGGYWKIKKVNPPSNRNFLSPN